MIHTYESKLVGFLSARLNVGDIVKVRRDDGSFDQYIVTESRGCPDCVCFKTDRCPVYEFQEGCQDCILCYGYPTRKPTEMSFKPIDDIMENL